MSSAVARRAGRWQGGEHVGRLQAGRQAVGGGRAGSGTTCQARCRWQVVVRWWWQVVDMVQAGMEVSHVR